MLIKNFKSLFLENLKTYKFKKMMPNHTESSSLAQIGRRYQFLSLLVSKYSSCMEEMQKSLICSGDISNIFLIFAWKKHVVSMLNNLVQGLEDNWNVFGVKGFEEFARSEQYPYIVADFKEKATLYYEIMMVFFEDYQGLMLSNETDEYYLILKNHLNDERQFKNYGETFKCFMTQYMLEKKKILMEEFKKMDPEDVQEQMGFQIKIIDFYDYQKIFVFDEKEEEGFDFEEYETNIREMEIKELFKYWWDRLSQVFEI